MSVSLVCGHAECVVGLPCRRGVSDKCAKGLHGFCRSDRVGCGCTGCHLGPCAQCGADNLLKIHDGLCASCYRDRAHARRSASSSCDKCGATGAFRNPVHRRNEYLCVDCHKAAGETLSLTSSVQHLVAACLTLPAEDSAHDWAHVKGNTFGCMRCKTKRYDPDLRKAMRRRDLRG